MRGARTLVLHTAARPNGRSTAVGSVSQVRVNRSYRRSIFRDPMTQPEAVVVPSPQQRLSRGFEKS